MDKKKLSPSSLTFEELDLEDSIMERIFEEIKKIPDKDQLDPVNEKDNIHKKHKSPKKISFKPDQELDLHGKTREESIFLVQNFVMTCHAKKFRFGLIITGKGLNSGEQGPVLNKEVKLWLERNGNPYLNDFHDAPRRFGGSGAIWLNFKKKVN